MLTLLSKPQSWQFHVVVLRIMSKNVLLENRILATHAARLFFPLLINDILVSDDAFTRAVVVA